MAATATSGGCSRDQSGGADGSGGTEGKYKFAEHGGLSCLRDAVSHPGYGSRARRERFKAVSLENDALRNANRLAGTDF
jgi:hypothetical protein